ncbi:MAG: group III truncated hemoglobin [Chitinophagales bacterium]|nr:group III truncated hemoglobin [Chitinophagales bacterium]MCO5281050.1 group III truncated hemoglobin [Chitinophagales bacterium]OJV26246.1 MAG: sec-independent protein translocase TatC [Bacteroidetes bacterium 37-13]HRN93949.1 group III truncated hemoglobin [Chitinophagales bacterium]HRP39501.1 group III truncated hemoglobin [Chitinophagales bacterium]
MPKSKKDITDRKDIELLVNTFYGKVQQNETLGYIFNDVAKVHWETHLPKMYNFWSSLLLGEQSYMGNPMLTHVSLSKETPLTDVEFNTWKTLFNQTVDELFEGEKATEAKTKAANVAKIMLAKIQSIWV